MRAKDLSSAAQPQPEMLLPWWAQRYVKEKRNEEKKRTLLARLGADAGRKPRIFRGERALKLIARAAGLGPPRPPHGGKANFSLGGRHKYLLQECTKPPAQRAHRLGQSPGRPKFAPELYQKRSAHEGSIEQ